MSISSRFNPPGGDDAEIEDRRRRAFKTKVRLPLPVSEDLSPRRHLIRQYMDGKVRRQLKESFQVCAGVDAARYGLVPYRWYRCSWDAGEHFHVLSKEPIE